jgi:1,4-dihydroxy-2-naphthoate octaprenyltransferase
MLASLPYGLSVMAVLLGKHVDQIDFDASKGIGTLPVLLGERGARLLTIGVIVAIYVCIIALIALGRLTPFAALTFVAVPRAHEAFRRLIKPRPPAPPADYVGWPLWYHRACLRHTRVFGWAYIAALALAALWHRMPVF